MKVAAAVVCLFLFSTFSLGNSIPIEPPITFFSISGIQSSLFSNTVDSQLWGATTFTSSLYIGPGDPFGTLCAALASSGSLSATILSFAFNPTTDLVTGTFQGTENIWVLPRKQFRVWKYAVSGTFSEVLNYDGKGTAEIDVTSETFLGTSAVPEPRTLVLVGSGLCWLVMLGKRHILC